MAAHTPSVQTPSAPTVGASPLSALFGAVSARRRLAAAGFAAVSLAALTCIALALGQHIGFAAVVPLYLLLVVVTSLIGGLVPAVASALAAAVLLNYYFVAPRHSLAIRDASNLVAIIVFLAIAVLVSQVVHLAAHRSAVVAAAVPLVESGRQRTVLLNAVSHDLRTPIAVAKAAVDSLRSADVQWSAAQRQELLATADTALQQLTGLVTNLLDLSRLQAGVLPVALASVGVDDVVLRALDYVDPDVTVDVDVPDDLPEVRADAGLLERAVANVVHNALRYTPTGVPVRVAGRVNGEHIEVLVIDRGPGIAADVYNRVFEPFQRSDDTPVDGSGIGLGLAIARGFTEAMGGWVTARPTPGGGTTLVLALQPAP